MQDVDPDVRHEVLLIFFEISKGLQDDDYEILDSDRGTKDKQDLSKRKAEKGAFSQHKHLSMTVKMGEDDDKAASAEKKKKSNKDGYANYIDRTSNIVNKKDNKRFISFAYDLPNLHFLANKRFLKEMA